MVLRQNISGDHFWQNCEESSTCAVGYSAPYGAEATWVKDSVVFPGSPGVWILQSGQWMYVVHPLVPRFQIFCKGSTVNCRIQVHCDHRPVECQHDSLISSVKNGQNSRYLLSCFVCHILNLCSPAEVRTNSHFQVFLQGQLGAKHPWRLNIDKSHWWMASVARHWIC